MSEQEDRPAEEEWHQAECLRPGLTAATATVLVRQVRQALTSLPECGATLASSLLIPEDEVSLCLFREGDDRARLEQRSGQQGRARGIAGTGWRRGCTGSSPAYFDAQMPS